MQDGPDRAVPVRPVPAHAEAAGVSVRFVLAPSETRPFSALSLWSFHLSTTSGFFLEGGGGGGIFQAPLLHEAEEIENTLQHQSACVNVSFICVRAVDINSPAPLICCFNCLSFRYK